MIRFLLPCAIRLSDTHQVVEIYVGLLLRCMHNFISDFINNMDRMRIFVMNPHQWSLHKQCSFKYRNVMSKSVKHAEAKRDGVINPQK